jgi:hypothetical protein
MEMNTKEYNVEANKPRPPSLTTVTHAPLDKYRIRTVGTARREQANVSMRTSLRTCTHHLHKREVGEEWGEGGR